MIDKKIIYQILGIDENIPLTSKEMASQLEITFYPFEKGNIPTEVLSFYDKLLKSFKDLSVNIIPFSEAVERTSFKDKFKRAVIFLKIYVQQFLLYFKKGENPNIGEFNLKHFILFVFSRKLKRDIAVFKLQQNNEDSKTPLPINLKYSFRRNPIITIVKNDSSLNINDDPFNIHMERALNLFSWYMSNIIIYTDPKYWTIYSFNLSHPCYELEDDLFNEKILSSLIPKIAAPVAPPSLKEFEISPEAFDPKDPSILPYINDIVLSGPMFEKTGLFPKGKKVSDLRFRNPLHAKIGSLHLDKRNGMSYGYLSRVMPINFGNNIENSKFESTTNKDFIINKDGKALFRVNFNNKSLLFELPDVWVVTTRSGSNKTSIDPNRDVILMGVQNGKLLIKHSKYINFTYDYKPSFDTKVILTHALTSAMFGSVLNYLGVQKEYTNLIASQGFALAHWHGYINQEKYSNLWNSYGLENPPVSCSAPQASVYAFEGKRKIIEDIILNQKVMKNEVHIEPQHGINVTYSSLLELSNLLVSKIDISMLGNKYFYQNDL
jgi:hypothetical protein